MSTNFIIFFSLLSLAILIVILIRLDRLYDRLGKVLNNQLLMNWKNKSPLAIIDGKPYLDHIDEQITDQQIRMFCVEQAVMTWNSQVCGLPLPVTRQAQEIYDFITKKEG